MKLHDFLGLKRIILTKKKDISANSKHHSLKTERTKPSLGDNKSGRLTVEELKRYPEMDNLTDEEAEQIIDSLQAISILGYETFISEYGKG